MATIRLKYSIKDIESTFVKMGISNIEIDNSETAYNLLNTILEYIKLDKDISIIHCEINEQNIMFSLIPYLYPRSLSHRQSNDALYFDNVKKFQNFIISNN